ncbi:MAG TPA: hypothetical protein VIP10_09440 [Burkholderiaceae bacterium]
MLTLDPAGRRVNEPPTRAHHSAAGVGAPACQNRALSAHTKAVPMDVEHINAIGNALADLSKRTVDLRGYL